MKSEINVNIDIIYDVYAFFQKKAMKFLKCSLSLFILRQEHNLIYKEIKWRYLPEL